MFNKKGFDCDKYLEIQSREILNRVEGFDKLYLEFGGKICDDFHAMRVLPGYEPNTKIRMLQMIKDSSEIVFCISAKDIENRRIRGDFNLTYEEMVLKSVGDLRSFGLDVTSVIINRFAGEKKALKFQEFLRNMGVRSYLQKEIDGYPADVEKIVSEEGYGENPYVETSKPIVVVTGVAPGSGKMSFCLSQMYHDSKKEIKSGFAKFETFPIWNLPIEHPINIAYEAATADIGDINMVDPFHLEAYNISSINYNRDIENFPILVSILKKMGNSEYKSPTDMGVSRAKDGIFDDAVVQEAAKQEIIRRYFRYKKERLFGIVDNDTIYRIEKLMQKLNLVENDRKTVDASKIVLEESTLSGNGNSGFYCGAAIELGDGRIITGKNSVFLHAESAAIINTLKELANIPYEIHLIPEGLIQGIVEMKKSFGSSDTSLDVSEYLTALAISAGINPSAQKCIEKIPLLKNSEMHITHLPTKGDEEGIRNLGINLTTSSEIA
jgi:uncharacterized protein (UPF0371 family)